jgi:hypothetical protein
MVGFGPVGDRDRPKKSWREIDAQRDRSGGQSPKRGENPRSAAQNERSSKQYRAALDALFEKGEVGKLAEKLAAPIRQPPALQDMPKPKAAPQPVEKPAPVAEDPRSILRKKIVTAIGREEISRAVDKYVKAHGMPEDFEVLEQALEHQKPERIAEALNVLDVLLGKEKPKRSRTLAGKLRFLEETSDDDELRATAARIRAKLG